MPYTKILRLIPVFAFSVSCTCGALNVIQEYDFSNFADGTADLTSAGFSINGDATISGGQLQLDGTGDYLQIASVLTNATSDNFVLEFIASASATPGTFNFIGAINAGTANNGFGIVAQNGNWNALTSLEGFAGSVAHGATPTANAAFAYVRDGGDVKLYVNGVEFNSGSDDGFTLGAASPNLTVGGHGFDVPSGLHNGTIDHVRVSTFDAGTFDVDELLAVPEPSAYALLMGCLAMGLVLNYRRR